MTCGFNWTSLVEMAEKNREQFGRGQPFPHICIDQFAEHDFATAMLADFPEENEPFWRSGDPGGLFQPGKKEAPDLTRGQNTPPAIQQALWAFSSPPFLNFLEIMTGIPNLIPDPYFLGGGPHLTGRDGSLAIHTDFNYHPTLKLYRRLNALFYLNKDWEPDYNGYLELVNPATRETEISLAPDFNRLVVFDIAAAPHGHPVPLINKDGITRKSLAFYYYTVEPNENDTRRTLAAGWKKNIKPAEFMDGPARLGLTRNAPGNGVVGTLELQFLGREGGIWTVDLAAGTIQSGSFGADCTFITPQKAFLIYLPTICFWKMRFAGASCIYRAIPSCS